MLALSRTSPLARLGSVILLHGRRKLTHPPSIFHANAIVARIAASCVLTGWTLTIWFSRPALILALVDGEPGEFPKYFGVPTPVRCPVFSPREPACVYSLNETLQDKAEVWIVARLYCSGLKLCYRRAELALSDFCHSLLDILHDAALGS